MAVTPLIEPAEERPKRKYVRRRKAGEQTLLDIAFEPLVKVGRGRRGKRLSAAEVLLQQMLERAQAGSVKDFTAILKYDQENQKARAKHEEKYGKDRPTRNNGRAAEAGLILDILALDTDARRSTAYWNSGFAEFAWEPLLTEWAFEAANRKLQEADELYFPSFPRSRFVIADEAIGEEEHRAKLRFLAQRKEWRQPSHHHWFKGRSGREAGRREDPLVLPFPYLDEVVIVEVEGRDREMTRCEAMICHLQHRARNGDVAVARALAPMFAKRQVADWNSKIESAYSHQVRHVFDAMRDLQMVSKRARKNCLYERWIVALALERLGERRLTPDEQAVVERATRKPHGDIWPDWWSPRLDRQTVESRHDIPDSCEIVRA